MQFGLALLLLAIVVIFALLVSRTTVGTVNTAVAAKPSVTVVNQTVASTPVTTATGGSGLSREKAARLNKAFQENGCPSFDADALQIELNKVPAGKIIFNLGKLADVTPTQISKFVSDNRRRFPFFVDYCDGLKTAKQFTQSLQGWVLNPLNRKR